MHKIPKIHFSQPFYDFNEGKIAQDIVLSRWVCGGSFLKELEENFSNYCKIEYAIGVSSWTTGAFLVLKALNIGPNDEVILPSSTFIATANVVSLVGATPVFVDVDLETGNINFEDIEKKITSKTKAIIPVDQLGNPCEINKINILAKKKNIEVIQDTACALGSFFNGEPVGSHSKISIFSMHARKIITTGEGGIVVTSCKHLAKKLRLLRHQGMSLTDNQRKNMPPTVYETYPIVGFNARLTDIQAGIGLVQFKKLKKILKRRQEIIKEYDEFFKNNSNIIVMKHGKNSQPNGQSYQIIFTKSKNDRIEMQNYLYKNNIPSKRGVMACHLEKPYKDNNIKLLNSEIIAKQGMQLPIHPDLTNEQQGFILSIIKKSPFFKKNNL